MSRVKVPNLPKCLTIPKEELESYALEELGLSLHGRGLDYDAIERRCLAVEQMILEQERTQREQKRTERLSKINFVIAIALVLNAAASWIAVFRGAGPN